MLASVMMEPPTGAAWLIVAVQVDVPALLKLAGVHVSAETEGTTTTPLAAPTEEIAEPVASTPIGLIRLIDMVGALAASVSWISATSPALMPVVFKPLTRHVKKPVIEAHAIDFPAAFDAAPAVALMAEIWLAG